METIEIIPLSGIKINEKTIPLSATRQEVESLLGTPYAEHSHSCYYSITSCGLTLTRTAL